MIEGALILLGGLVAGWVSGRLSGRKPKPPAPLRLICSCDHSSGSHDPETGHCLAETKRAIEWNDAYAYPEEHPVDFEYAQCPCRRYDGPLQIENWVPREITTRPEEQA